MKIMADVLVAEIDFQFGLLGDAYLQGVNER